MVTDAVVVELASLRSSGSALGATALALAAAVDEPDSTTSMAMCARELRETMERVRAIAAKRPEADRLDDLAGRRAQRVASA